MDLGKISCSVSLCVGMMLLNGCSNSLPGTDATVELTSLETDSSLSLLLGKSNIVSFTRRLDLEQDLTEDYLLHIEIEIMNQNGVWIVENVLGNIYERVSGSGNGSVSDLENLQIQVWSYADYGSDELIVQMVFSLDTDDDTEYLTSKLVKIDLSFDDPLFNLISSQEIHTGEDIRKTGPQGIVKNCSYAYWSRFETLASNPFPQ